MYTVRLYEILKKGNRHNLGQVVFSRLLKLFPNISELGFKGYWASTGHIEVMSVYAELLYNNHIRQNHIQYDTWWALTLWHVTVTSYQSRWCHREGPWLVYLQSCCSGMSHVGTRCACDKMSPQRVTWIQTDLNPCNKSQRQIALTTASPYGAWVPGPMLTNWHRHATQDATFTICHVEQTLYRACDLTQRTADHLPCCSLLLIWLKHLTALKTYMSHEATCRGGKSSRERTHIFYESTLLHQHFKMAN